MADLWALPSGPAAQAVSFKYSASTQHLKLQATLPIDPAVSFKYSASTQHITSPVVLALEPVIGDPGGVLLLGTAPPRTWSIDVDYVQQAICSIAISSDYSLELDYSNSLLMKGDIGKFDITYQINGNSPQHINFLNRSPLFLRSIEKNVNVGNIDFSNNSRRHISYIAKE